MNDSGFSLVELMVVIAVIAIISINSYTDVFKLSS
ncbi:MAG: prepilin-type N-terminal cleavage/methylation domain-containing protein [Francisella endosymbiont of Hyalomma asiaticum]